MTRPWILIAVLVAAFVGGEMTVAVQHAKAQAALPRAVLQRNEQQSAQTNQAAIPKLPQPFDEASLPSNGEERANREAKNRRYNRGEHAFTMTGPDEVIGVVCTCPEMMPLLPTARTPMIVIATIMSEQPYLSEDRSFIYTEYTVQVEEFLKKDTDKLPMAGERLIVNYSGGWLRLRNGHTISYFVNCCDRSRPLHVGERCILFLNPINDGADLHIGLSFLLRNGQAYVLGGQVGQEMLVGALRDVPKELSQEVEFLKAVRQAIKNPSSPPFYVR